MFYTSLKDLLDKASGIPVHIEFENDPKIVGQIFQSMDPTTAGNKIGCTFRIWVDLDELQAQYPGEDPTEVIMALGNTIQLAVMGTQSNAENDSKA